MRKCITALLIFLGSSLMMASISSPSDSDAQATATAMLNRFVDSWNRYDGNAYSENYWPEAELVDPLGRIHTGRAAIVKIHVDLWAGAFKGTQVSGKIRRIQMLGDRYMIVDFDLDVSGAQQLPSGGPSNATGPLRSHLKHVMEKRDGVWKVLSAQNTFIAEN